MTIITVPDTTLCNNTLPVQTALGGLELPPKRCVREKGHDGPHTDGSAVWINVERHNEWLEKRSS